MLRPLTGMLLRIDKPGHPAGSMVALSMASCTTPAGMSCSARALIPLLETGIIPGQEVAISARSCETPSGLCGECSSQRGSPVPGPHGLLGHPPFSIAVCAASARATVPLTGDG
ncbi:MAG: hypothetical protein QOH77_1012 [Actinomycetota bacterium]|nr:hypothetical protein [Actinomycetota bacterium]